MYSTYQLLLLLNDYNLLAIVLSELDGGITTRSTAAYDRDINVDSLHRGNNCQEEEFG